VAPYFATCSYFAFKTLSVCTPPGPLMVAPQDVVTATCEFGVSSAGVARVFEAGASWAMLCGGGTILIDPHLSTVRPTVRQC